MTTQRTRRGAVAMFMLPVMVGANPIVAMVLSIALPAIATGREMTRRTMCLVNLSGMGKACMLYMIEHEEQFPPDLQALVKDGNDPRLFECPSSPLKGPSYFYLPPQPPRCGPRTAIACDYYCNHRGVRHVLFADCHAEPMTDVSFDQLMALPENARFAQALAAAEGSLRAKGLAPKKP